LFKDYYPDRDAFVVEKLKKAVIQAFIETYKPSFGTYRPRKKDEEIYLSVYRELQK